jgi:hypothetical protein
LLADAGRKLIRLFRKCYKGLFLVFQILGAGNRLEHSDEMRDGLLLRTLACSAIFLMIARTAVPTGAIMGTLEAAIVSFTTSNPAIKRSDIVLWYESKCEWRPQRPGACSPALIGRYCCEYRARARHPTFGSPFVLCQMTHNPKVEIVTNLAGVHKAPQQ